jgi:hypothetical protein
MFQWGLTTLGWFHNDEISLMAHGVVVWKKQQLLPFSQFVSPMLFFTNLPIVSLDNEHHNFENKDLENDGFKG